MIINLSQKKIILLKNTFKVVLQYLFNIFILFMTLFYLKHNFILKRELKTCSFENLVET